MLTSNDVKRFGPHAGRNLLSNGPDLLSVQLCYELEDKGLWLSQPAQSVPPSTMRGRAVVATSFSPSTVR